MVNGRLTPLIVSIFKTGKCDHYIIFAKIEINNNKNKSNIRWRWKYKLWFNFLFNFYKDNFN